MKHKILNEKGVNPFSVIRTLPDMPLFKDCPIKPKEETIKAAENLYLKFSHEPPTYVSSKDEQVIFEWNYYKKDDLGDNLIYTKELVVKDSLNSEWREFKYE